MADILTRKHQLTDQQISVLRRVKRRGHASKRQAWKRGISPEVAHRVTEDISGPGFKKSFGPLDEHPDDRD